MNTKLEFVVALNHISCNGNLHNGIKLVNGLRLIDDPFRISAIKESPFQETIGRLELGAIRKAKLLVVSEPDTLVYENGLDGPQTVYHLLNIVRSYLMHLWIVRDHCGSFDQGFLFETDTKRGVMLAHSQSLAASFFKADGSSGNTAFSRNELEQFRINIRVYDSVQDSVTRMNDAEAAKRLISGKDVDIYERFLRFIAFGRETRDQGMRIAMYCSALETLLSHASATELTHKISERVALLIANTGRERIAMFQLMKKLYSIRSSVVHGTDITKKQLGNLTDLSKEADGIVRAVTIIYQMDKKFRTAVNSQDDAENFFLEKMFCKE